VGYSTQVTQRVTDCFVLETDLLCIGSSVIPADPVFNRASPAPTIGEPLAVTRPIEIDDLPNIDVPLISHDHCDQQIIIERDNKAKQGTSWYHLVLQHT
jgi:L-ascorbate metabolism protein UlaG (beta-lactamase superfamily)